MVQLKALLVAAAIFGLTREFTQAAPDDPPSAKCVLRLEPEIDCPSCEDGIKRTLVNARGVRSAEIDLLKNRIVVRYDPGRINIRALVGRIRVLGYTAQETK